MEFNKTALGIGIAGAAFASGVLFHKILIITYLRKSRKHVLYSRK